MKLQLVLLIVCLVSSCRAQEEPEDQEQKGEAGEAAAEAAPANLGDSRPDRSNASIRRILDENTKVLRQLDNKAQGISNSQKGIEGKLRLLGQDVAGIERLEDGLKRLELSTAANFHLTAHGIRNLTASIRAAENKTDWALLNLARGQQDIKQLISKVDANQNKHEHSLDQATKSVTLRLSALDNLLKQSVLKEVVALVQVAKKLEQSQRLIENKVGHLDELTALSGLTASKVHQLEHGLRSINSTQHRQLAAIGHTVEHVGASTWQIDNKLGVLLSTQKNIERALVECKKCFPSHKQPESPHDRWQQPGYISYDHKEANKPSSKEYESSYDHADEASYLYQLWYGKDDK
ncbi:uncharacterized protein LOC6578109 [Drosophila mojavensis]|uniref:Uncharacterized protein, isoform C n=1 Tax=Drosophila mojavensis TaxID=7230 RepID=A0A0Q9XHP5_DROMO|nr:uncharacterized protein LOC6578109 [Drosophila mojavensis]KRG03777.1 uncharacterized protein Dmoj_GI18227, isoform C [Drosophila mojavensis]